MPIEIQTQMRLGRLLIIALAIIIATYTIFKTTSDLDEVRNAWVYRACYGMAILQIICATAFDVLNLFPLE